MHLHKGDHVKLVLEQVLAQEGLTNVIDCETIAEYIIKMSSLKDRCVLQHDSYFDKELRWLDKVAPVIKEGTKTVSGQSESVKNCL